MARLFNSQVREGVREFWLRWKWKLPDRWPRTRWGCLAILCRYLARYRRDRIAERGESRGTKRRGVQALDSLRMGPVADGSKLRGVT